MCGIAGIFQLREAGIIDEVLLRWMTDSMIHRGPDEAGIFVDKGVGLGHRRLSIIDLSTGQQPMLSADGRTAIVFNGEIYNYLELRKELEAVGCCFSRNSDTEVLLNAWIAWGENCVKRLRGMFAFAIFDARRDCLFLARDCLGKKPLYYAELPNGEFVFGSELKALTEHPALPRKLNPAAIEEYFTYGYIPEPNSIFTDAKKLPPASSMLITRSRVGSPQSFWDIPFSPVPVANEQEAREELVARLSEAVRIRLMSEVPLGAFLSGGVDSGSVVAMMAKESRDKVNTCSISFSDPAFDESEYAASVARRYNTNHTVYQVNPDDFFSLIDKLSEVYDEPYADSSALPTYRVCQLARQRVTVALSGDGGDENLAGYRRYEWHLRDEWIRRWFPLQIRRSFFGRLEQLLTKSGWQRGKGTLQRLASDGVGAYLYSMSIFKDDARKQLYSDTFRSSLQGYRGENVVYGYMSSAPTDHPLSLIQYIDFKTYLVGDILTKVDRASMANSLEVRVPFLDARFVEWMSGLPPDMKLNRREGKYLLKKAMAPYLPHDLMYRNKMGFAVPLAGWFRGPLRERIRQELLEGALPESGLFNRIFLEQLLEQHGSGLRDLSVALWTLMMFARFLSRYKPSSI